MPATVDVETARSIERAVLDYYQGWFDADPARMDVASVTVQGGPYYEYLHLVPTSAGWKIANALWRSR